MQVGSCFQLGGKVRNEDRRFSVGGSASKQPKSEGRKYTPKVFSALTKQKKAVTVDFKTHPAQKVQGSVDPRFPAGLPFPVLEILEVIACGDPGKLEIFGNFRGIFPEFGSGVPERIPQKATAFSSCLI